MAMLKLHHFYKLDNVCTLTQLGEYRKIPAFGLGISLNLMLVFPSIPLLLFGYRPSKNRTTLFHSPFHREICTKYDLICPKYDWICHIYVGNKLLVRKNQNKFL